MYVLFYFIYKNSVILYQDIQIRVYSLNNFTTKYVVSRRVSVPITFIKMNYFYVYTIVKDLNNVDNFNIFY